MKFNFQKVKEKQKNLTSTEKKKKNKKVIKVIRIILLTLLSIFCIVLFTGLGIAVGIAKSTPSMEEISVVPTMYPTKILDCNGNETIQLSAAGAKRTEASLDEIPEHLKWAFIDLEDERFYQHHGVDLAGIARAAYSTVVEHSSQGASTITQQLIKNNVFETGGFERSTGSLIRRKIQEQILALGLEKEMSKDEILINYLNTINLGGGNYGVKTAAKFYFNKDVSALTVSEAAVIAAITQNPSANNPARHPEKNKKRAMVCLEYMKKNGHITQAQYDEAVADDPYSRIDENAISSGTLQYSYFVDALVNELMDDLQEKAGMSYARAYNMLYSGGLTVYSTQDPVVQEIVDREINDINNYYGVLTYSISWDLTVERANGDIEYYNQRDITKYMQEVKGYANYTEYDVNARQQVYQYKHDYQTTEEADAVVAEYKQYLLKEGDKITYENIVYTPQPQASFTVEDYTNGHVLAINGGRGDKTQNLTLNRATDTARQPGSCFKVLASFGPAIDAGGFTLATTMDDSEFNYGGENGRYVENWWGGEYRGLSTVREGISNSMNIVAVKTLHTIGPALGVQYLLNMGFTTIDPVLDESIATAIGGITYGIKNIEINAAYSGIANKGQYIEPILYTKVVAMDGTVIIDNVPEQHQIFKESTASLLTSAMMDVVTTGTAPKANIPGTMTAGKTGTTNSDKDFWFCGFVPNGICGSIWTGYDENMQNYTPYAYHEEIWVKIMYQILEATGRQGGSFEMTGGITQASVCKKSGKVPNSFCDKDPGGSCVYTEYFANDNLPTGSCDVHTEVKVCAETELLPGPDCPTKMLVCRTRPMDIRGGAARGTTWDTKYAPPTEKCKVDHKTELSKAKANARKELEELADGWNGNTEIMDALKEGKAEIEEAKIKSDVNSILERVKAKINELIEKAKEN